MKNLFVMLCVLALLTDQVNAQEIELYSVEDGKIVITNGVPKKMTPPGSALLVTVPSFAKNNAAQDLPDWCWAACIQAVIKTAGVDISQEEIVNHVKGSISFDKATADEINNFFIQGKWVKPEWTQRSGYRAAYSNHFNNAMWGQRFHQNFLLRHLGSQRSIAIASYKNKEGINHAVVIYELNLTVGKSIDTISYFDPANGESKTIPFTELDNLITDIWLPFMVSRVF